MMDSKNVCPDAELNPNAPVDLTKFWTRLQLRWAIQDCIDEMRWPDQREFMLSLLSLCDSRVNGREIDLTNTSAIARLLNRPQSSISQLSGRALHSFTVIAMQHPIMQSWLRGHDLTDSL